MESNKEFFPTRSFNTFYLLCDKLTNLLFNESVKVTNDNCIFNYNGSKSSDFLVSIGNQLVAMISVVAKNPCTSTVKMFFNIKI